MADQLNDRWVDALRLIANQVKRNDQALRIRYQNPVDGQISYYELSRHMDLDGYNMEFSGKYEFMNGITLRDASGAEVSPDTMLYLGEDNPGLFLEHIDEPMNAIRHLEMQEAAGFAEQGYIVDLEVGDKQVTFRNDMGDGVHIMIDEEDIGLDSDRVRELFNGHEADINKQLATTQNSVRTMNEMERFAREESGRINTEYFDKRGRPHTLTIEHDRASDTCRYYRDGKEITKQAAFNSVKHDPKVFYNSLRSDIRCLAKADAAIKLAKNSQVTRQDRFGDWQVSYVYNPERGDVRVFANIDRKDNGNFRAGNGMQEISREELAKIIQHSQNHFNVVQSAVLKTLKDKVYKGEQWNGKEINPNVLDTIDLIERNREEELLGFKLNEDERAAASDVDDLGHESMMNNEPIVGYDAKGRHIMIIPETDATRNIKDGFVGYDIFVDGQQYNVKQVLRDPDLVAYLDEKNIDLQYVNELRNQALESGQRIAYEFTDKSGKNHMVQMFKDSETGKMKMTMDGKEVSSSELLSNQDAMKAMRIKYGPSFGQKLGKTALNTLHKGAQKTARTATRMAERMAGSIKRSFEESLTL